MALLTVALVVILLSFLGLLILLLFSPCIIPDKKAREFHSRHLHRRTKPTDLEAGPSPLRPDRHPSLQERLSAGREKHFIRLSKMEDAQLEQPKPVHVDLPPRPRMQEQGPERTLLPGGFEPTSFRARAQKDPRFAKTIGSRRAPPGKTIRGR